MALSRDTITTIFRVEADSKPAIQEFEKLKTEIGKSAKNTQAIVRESFETLSSEIIESFGIDGDIANSIANQLVVVRNASFIAAAAITGAFVAVGVGLVLAANKAAELGNEIADLQKVTGLTAETLSGLNAAAREEGKTLEDLSGTLVTFNKNLVDAQRGSKEFQTIFKQLGVDFRGNTDAALRQAIERIAGMRDGAQKAALAQKVFGDNIEDVIIVLSNLEGGIDGAIKKAKELGLFFDQDAVKAAVAYQNQINALKVQFEGLAVTIGNSVIPVLSGLLFYFNEGAKAARALFTGTQSVTTALANLVKLGSLILRPDLLVGIAGVASQAGVSSSPTGTPTTLPRIGGGKKKEDKLEEINLDKEIAQLQARLQREALDREVTLLKMREEAQERHRRALEQIDQEFDERTIAAIEREAEQRAITEEQAAEQIGAIRIAAFARRELELKAEIESVRNRLQGEFDETLREELLNEEQEFLDELELLQQRRTAIEEQAVDAVIRARERDLQNLIDSANEQKRIYQELEDARREQERQGLTQGIFGEAFGETLRRTGSELQAFGALFAEVQGSIAQKLADMPSLAEAGFGAFTDGLTEMLTALVLTGQTGPAAFRQLAAGVIAAVAKMAVVKAVYELAEGFAALARGIFGDPRGFAEATMHFKAAAIYGVVAAVSGLAARAIAPSAGGAAGGGGGAGGTGEGGRRIIEQGDRSPREPQVIIIRAEMQEGVIVRRVMDDYRANGGTRQLLRGDLLGEQPA